MAGAEFLKQLRARAAAGELLTVEECRQFVAATRKSFSALLEKKKEKEPEKTPHSRVKKEKPQDVDFF